MVDSRYQQPLTDVGDTNDSEDEDLVVQDDELLINEQDSTVFDGRRFSGAPRMSRRAPRSGLRSGSFVHSGELIAGKYMVEAVRGRSGPEMVVFARHVELDQRVRLRYLVPEASASPDAVARFQRGARKAREMRSEHAERIIDFGRLESGSPYRVGEMPGGPSLEEMLRVRGAIAISEAVDILIAVCEPVAEAHASGIVHRSLCTSGIFVERRADGSNLVKVVDFGVADPLQTDALPGESLRPAAPVEGAMAFAAPEQIRNSSAVDARADVWALGCVLYELLTGVRVFVAETQLTLLAMIAADQPAPIHWLVPEIPDALERIVLSCLEKDPEGRPRSVVELAVALAPFGSGDAPGVAGRLARIAMRSTRPPPLPSGAPTSIPPSMRTRAIVRTTPPLTKPVEKPPALPSWATMTGGALLGICAALVAALVLRLQPPPAAVPAAAVAPAAAPVPAPLVIPAPAPTTVATTATTAAAEAAPVVQRPARHAETEAKPPTPTEARPAPKTETPAATRPVAPKRERTAAPAETVAGRTTPTPNALFGGID